MVTHIIPERALENAINDCKTFEEFAGKYRKPKRFTELGNDYVSTVLKYAHKQIQEIGYASISKHENITGKLINFIPPINVSGQFLDIWEAIARKNLWIKRDYPGQFTKSLLHPCNDPYELDTKIHDPANWQIGQGFYYGNICLIYMSHNCNQWLAIKDDFAFDILFTDHLTDMSDTNLLYRILNASKTDCIENCY